ncbi:MAG TPA: hypothetical protein VMC84_13230, partial [Methanocella sp.]|nr:hypothetical protein [Methanocella sp.]
KTYQGHSGEDPITDRNEGRVVACHRNDEHERTYDKSVEDYSFAIACIKGGYQVQSVLGMAHGPHVSIQYIGMSIPELLDDRWKIEKITQAMMLKPCKLRIRVE